MSNSSANSKERFSNRVDAYVAARPRYPREVIEHLKREIGLTPQWTVADIGSGTGISAELFLHLDFAGPRARVLSSSHMPAADDPRHEPMLAEVRRLFDQHQQSGQVTIIYRTEMLYGALRQP